MKINERISSNIYIYHKFPTELILKAFTDLGNVIFSSMKCCHPDHKREEIKFTISHIKDHFTDFPNELQSLNVESLLLKAINMASIIGKSLRVIKMIQERRKKQGVYLGKTHLLLNDDEEELIIKSKTEELYNARKKLDKICKDIEIIMKFITKLRKSYSKTE